ncbi:hypothetical protein SAMN04488540_1221, partial [Ferrimonas sediminum]
FGYPHSLNGNTENMVGVQGRGSYSSPTRQDKF